MLRWGTSVVHSPSSSSRCECCLAVGAHPATTRAHLRRASFDVLFRFVESSIFVTLRRLCASPSIQVLPLVGHHCLGRLLICFFPPVGVSEYDRARYWDPSKSTSDDSLLSYVVSGVCEGILPYELAFAVASLRSARCPRSPDASGAAARYSIGSSSFAVWEFLMWKVGVERWEGGHAGCEWAGVLARA